MRHASLFLPLVLSGCAFFGLQPEGDSASSGGDGDGDMVGDGEFIGDGDGDLSTGGATGDGDMSTGMRPGDGDGDTGGSSGDGDGDTGGTMSGDGDTGGTGSGGAGSGGNGSGGSGLTPEQEQLREYQMLLQINEIKNNFVELHLGQEMPPETSLDGFAVTVNDGDSCSLSGITMSETNRFAIAKTTGTSCLVSGMCQNSCSFDIGLSDVIRLMVELNGDWYQVDEQQHSSTSLAPSQTYAAFPDGSDVFEKLTNSQGMTNE